MIDLNWVFGMYVFLLAVIGAMRGWAKELLVVFSFVLSMFFLAILVRFNEAAREFIFGGKAGAAQFWMQALLMGVLVFFGYQTPGFTKAPVAKERRDRLAVTVLGFLLGALNGFLIIGTLWFFMDQAGYPFTPEISKAKETPWIMDILPPKWLIQSGGSYNSPVIFFAVAIAFMVVLVIFV
ncbi:MAG: hypothetical protein L0Z70_04765 [Chloroflexi bacterium]|nr:hypothetical protein [Chloroflexota bacterium]